MRIPGIQIKTKSVANKLWVIEFVDTSTGRWEAVRNGSLGGISLYINDWKLFYQYSLEEGAALYEDSYVRVYNAWTKEIRYIGPISEFVSLRKPSRAAGAEVALVEGPVSFDSLEAF